jgi:hypothetical protein
MIFVWLVVALASLAFFPYGPFIVLIAVLASIATRKTDGQIAKEEAARAASSAALWNAVLKTAVKIDAWQVARQQSTADAHKSANVTAPIRHYDYDINGERFEVRQPRQDGKWDGRPQDTLGSYS